MKWHSGTPPERGSVLFVWRIVSSVGFALLREIRRPALWEQCLPGSFSLSACLPVVVAWFSQPLHLSVCVSVRLPCMTVGKLPVLTLVRPRCLVALSVGACAPHKAAVGFPSVSPRCLLVATCDHIARPDPVEVRQPHVQMVGPPTARPSDFVSSILISLVPTSIQNELTLSGNGCELPSFRK